jgi:hypothetical protein
LYVAYFGLRIWEMDFSKVYEYKTVGWFLVYLTGFLLSWIEMLNVVHSTIGWYSLLGKSRNSTRYRTVVETKVLRVQEPAHLNEQNSRLSPQGVTKRFRSKRTETSRHIASLKNCLQNESVRLCRSCGRWIDHRSECDPSTRPAQVAGSRESKDPDCVGRNICIPSRRHECARESTYERQN